jgi:hypothetical protein
MKEEDYDNEIELSSDDIPIEERFFIAQGRSNSLKHHIYDRKKKRLVCGRWIPRGFVQRKKGHVDAAGAVNQLGNLSKYCNNCMLRIEY